MKSIVISIKPKYVVDILNGKKTIEVRKSIPKKIVDSYGYIKEPADVYIYCTKSKNQEDMVYKNVNSGNYFTGGNFNKGDFKYNYTPINLFHCRLNGNIVAKFRLDKIKSYRYGIVEFSEDFDLMALKKEEFVEYAKSKTVYGWKIDNLDIFDEPLSLEEIGLKKAPQSWQYIYNRKDDK